MDHLLTFLFAIYIPYYFVYINYVDYFAMRGEI